MELVSDIIRSPHILPLHAPTIIVLHRCHFTHVNGMKVSHFFYLLSYVTYYWPLCISHVRALIDNYIRQTEQMHIIITYNLQLKYYSSNM